MSSEAPTSADAPPRVVDVPEGPAMPETEVEVPPVGKEVTAAVGVPPRRPGRLGRLRPIGRRRGIVAAVVALGLVAALVAVVATRGDDDEAGTSTGTSTSVPATTTPDEPSTTASGAPATTSAPVVTTAPAPSTSVPSTPAPGALPDDPDGYALAAFTAWQQGDLAALSDLATPAVVAFLSAVPPDAEGWGAPQYEGAMGSTYASWTRTDLQIVLRVGNEMAQLGEPHAVREVFFSTAPGQAAIWPFTTQDEATNTQQQVDQGHQPWLVDPAAVASSYAQAELGWANATVQAVQPGEYRVTDPASGVVADVALSQPARTGAGGIWAVTRAGSA